MKQLNHYNTNFTKHVFPITLVCDNITDAQNIGSLFRTADSFGVEKLIFCGSTISLGRKMLKTSRATEKYVNYDVCNEASEIIKTLKNEGHHIIALEITTHSQSIHNYSFKNSQPIVLVMGDENFGISESVLLQADAIVHIDMYGQNSSMNVVQATTVALYEITKQLCL